MRKNKFRNSARNNSMPEISIEPYSDLYKAGVGALITGIQTGEFGIPITLEQQPDLLEIPTFYQVHDGNFWIAKTGDQVVGTIALLDIEHGQGALRKMFVAKAYR